MTTSSLPSLAQLKRAVQLSEQIEKLKEELATLLGSASPTADELKQARVTVTATVQGSRVSAQGSRVSAQGSQRIAAAQRRRWARFRRAQLDAAQVSGAGKNGRASQGAAHAPAGSAAAQPGEN